MNDYRGPQPQARPRDAAHPVGAGVAAAAAGAAVWALAAYVTSYQFEILAVLTGIGVRAAVMRRGAPPTPRLMAAGAALAVASCAAGTLLAMIAVLYGKYDISLGVILGHLSLLLHAYPAVVGWKGVLFWAAAAAAGASPRRRRPVYRHATRQAARDGAYTPTVPTPVWDMPASRPGPAPDLAPYLDGPRGHESGARDLR